MYYRNYYAPKGLGADDERAAWFVGFAENVGHSMTYRVLSKETMELLSVSSLRRAADGRNAVGHRGRPAGGVYRRLLPGPRGARRLRVSGGGRQHGTAGHSVA